MMIHHLRGLKMKQFDIHFTLWHGGGLDFKKELDQWQAKQDAEWHLVSRGRRSYASAVRSGARSWVFSRLKLPESFFDAIFGSEDPGLKNKGSHPSATLSEVHRNYNAGGSSGGPTHHQQRVSRNSIDHSTERISRGSTGISKFESWFLQQPSD